MTRWPRIPFDVRNLRSLLVLASCIALLVACGDADDLDFGAGAAGQASGADSGVDTDGGWGSGGAAGYAGYAGHAGYAGYAGEGGAAGTPPGGAAGAGGATASGGAPGSGGSGGSGGSPAGCPRVRVKVAAGATLNVRPTPSTSGSPVGTLPNGAIVDVVAQVQGETINGTTLWFQISAPSVAGYISAAYSECTVDQPAAVTGYYLPLQCGKSAKISQGNFGSFSHSGKAKYAYDFSLGVGTPMVAMADGKVLHVYDKTKPGDPCYNGGGSSCYPYANLVVLLHGDGSTSIYKHLSQVSVALGQNVKRGAQLGSSGSTGYSTGPHAHVMRQENCGVANCQSIPLKFADVAGGGVPSTGQTVTSKNCP